MNFLSKNKLKIKRKAVEDGIKFYIDYNRLKELKDINNFKLILFKEIVENKPCLAIIDTNLMYFKKNIDIDAMMNELEELFSKLLIKYKKIIIKDTQDMGIFGVPIKLDTKKKHNGYIMAFICTSENYENIISIINDYNINCYIQSNGVSEDDLLSKVNFNYDEEDFIYQIYNDNFIKSIVIYSKNEDSHVVSQIIDKINLLII